MTDRGSAMTTTELEAALADLGSGVAYPPTPDLATGVGARLRSQQDAAAPPRPVWRPLARSLLLAAALALLVVGAALAVRLGLDLLSIEFGTLPSPGPSAMASTRPTSSVAPPTPSGAPDLGVSLGLGTLSSLEEARAAAAFELRVPETLGAPDAVFLGGPDLRGQVAFLYDASDTLPASNLLGGGGLLVTQNHGEPDDGLAHKLVDAESATVTPVMVDGAPGLWISGKPHAYWYLAPDGAFIEESRRLVGDTLVWELDGLLYRIEGDIPLERALEIARSMR